MNIVELLGPDKCTLVVNSFIPSNFAIVISFGYYPMGLAGFEPAWVFRIARFGVALLHLASLASTNSATVPAGLSRLLPFFQTLSVRSVRVGQIRHNDAFGTSKDSNLATRCTALAGFGDVSVTSMVPPV